MTKNSGMEVERFDTSVSFHSFNMWDLRLIISGVFAIGVEMINLKSYMINSKVPVVYVVRTSGFQPDKPGASPGWDTRFCI